MNWYHPRSLHPSISMWDSSGTHHPLGVAWIMDVGLAIWWGRGEWDPTFQAEGKRLFLMLAGP